MGRLRQRQCYGAQVLLPGQRKTIEQLWETSLKSRVYSQAIDLGEVSHSFKLERVKSCIETDVLPAAIP